MSWKFCFKTNCPLLLNSFKYLPHEVRLFFNSTHWLICKNSRERENLELCAVGIYCVTEKASLWKLCRVWRRPKGSETRGVLIPSSCKTHHGTNWRHYFSNSSETRKVQVSRILCYLKETNKCTNLLGTLPIHVNWLTLAMMISITNP